MAALAGHDHRRRGGTRLAQPVTAELAKGLGYEIGAVPGPVSARLSAGPNALLADQRAHLIRDADDVLDVLLRDSAVAEGQPPTCRPSLRKRHRAR